MPLRYLRFSPLGYAYYYFRRHYYYDIDFHDYAIDIHYFHYFHYIFIIAFSIFSARQAAAVKRRGAAKSAPRRGAAARGATAVASAQVRALKKVRGGAAFILPLLLSYHFHYYATD